MERAGVCALEQTLTAMTGSHSPATANMREHEFGTTTNFSPKTTFVLKTKKNKEQHYLLSLFSISTMYL